MLFAYKLLSEYQLISRNRQSIHLTPFISFLDVLVPLILTESLNPLKKLFLNSSILVMKKGKAFQPFLILAIKV